MAASVSSTPAAWHSRPGAFAPSIPPAWQRRLRIAVLAVAFLAALFAGFGFLAVPWIAKRQVVALAASELGRQATIGEIRFNPFTLRGRISDFTLADREPGRTLLAFESLDLNLAWDSIAKAALMVEEVRLAGPRLRISLDAAGKSNIADIVERAMAPRGDAKALAFAVHNIEVEGGTVFFEDARRGHKTQVDRLALGLPFLSSRPSDTTIRVKPHLSGVIDGAAFAFEGTTSSPFDDIQRAALSLDFDALALPRYVEYAPLPNGLKLTDGALSTRLTLSFLTWKGQARGLELAGTASLDRLAIARPDGSPLVAVKRVEAQLQRLDALGRSVILDRVAVSGPELDLRRREDGTLELPALFASPATPANGMPREDSAAQPWSWSVREASLADGHVRFVDASVTPPYATTLSGFVIGAAKVASRGEPGTIEASFQAGDGARFSARANVDVAAQAARGRFEVQGVAIAPLHAYYDKSLAMDVRRGSVSFAGDFEAATGKLALSGGSVVLEDLDAALRGEREPLVRLSRLEAKDIAIDPAARKVAVGSIAANQGALRLLREADGRMSFQRALPAAEPYRVGAGAKAVTEAQWAAVVNEVLVEGLAADFEDRAVQPAVKVQLAQARLAARNLDSAPGAKANVDLAARVGSKGRIALKGTVGLQPLAVQADVQAAGIDLVAYQPYAAAATNVIATSGTVDVRGRVAYDTGSSGPNLRYLGDLAVNGFGSLDQPNSQELMRWKSLAVTGIDLATAPFRVAAGAIALDHFYARLILDADAKLNLVQLLKSEPVGDASPAPAPAEATPPRTADIPAAIARVQLSNGEVEFSDFFIRPNYSAHLTDLEGRLDGLAASQAGTVEVTARLDGAAPVDIRGMVNPFAKELKLDIDAKATGADLSPLTPYAVKYAGYGIEKGKLSMEVHYTVEERKLSATNRITLDQLTFGDRVDSPTATKLPVLLLVSLLKDRDGVIKLDLPIAGTLDDPQFSIWRIVLQIIGNLLTKAATAPFALLGALAGGGEQLAYVEFQPGLAALTPASEQKLATLSKALVDRPHVKLDATGRAIPEVDADGLRRAALDRALRHAKQKELARKGESAPPIEEIVLEPADNAKYLKVVYDDTKVAGKPRNLIGMAKEIPPEEMEKLLLAGYTVGDDALRELANDRAEAVRNWFVTKGNVPAERVFIAAPKLGSDGMKGEGAPTRVDFAIR